MTDWYRKETGEIDREKVIDELERDFERMPDEETHVVGTFDREAVGCALELLKAQEPHVMTITEAFDAEVAWLERYADPDDGVEPIIQPVIIRYYENGYWQCLIEKDESADLSLFIDEFGTEFRFWTSRPSEAQRKAVKGE